MKATANSLKNKHQWMIFLQLTSIIAIIFSTLFCATFFTLFADFDITVMELASLFLNTLAVSWIFMITIKLLFKLLVYTVGVIDSKLFTLLFRELALRRLISALLIAACLLGACNNPPLAGISKELNTGMVTTYSKMKPENTVLVMNEEKLGHTQIPLGEKFVVINEKVQGLVVKDNKISIGCSLLITDTQGKELLNESDLFKNGGGIYDQKDAEYLKCTVSTGKPMDYDKEYKVAVKFWDKYGSGTIENKLSISIIDIP